MASELSNSKKLYMLIHRKESSAKRFRQKKKVSNHVLLECMSNFSHFENLMSLNRTDRALQL